MVHAVATPSRLHCIDSRDDVAVALENLAAGETLSVGPVELTVRAPIQRGHKVAVRAVAAGEPVHKYGAVIGAATQDIAPGDWVHTHNLRTRLAGLASHQFTAARPAPPVVPSPLRFDGYRRSDGRVGTRNDIWIISTVGCVSRTAERIAQATAQQHAGKVDAIVPLTHPFGCSQTGLDLDRTRHLLASLAAHPNAGGVLIVGLGCESNQARDLLAAIDGRDRERIRMLGAQDCDDEVERGIECVDELVEIAAGDRREPCGLEDLCVGLKCGGSDGFSGLTANPLVGRIADRVTAAGGRAILTEIPELFGAEHLLLERAASVEVFDAVAGILDDFRRYFISHGEPLHENPSPGNIAGGITTLEEKSLGAVQKGGHAPVTGALRYGERIERAGLAVLEAPGNDAVSSTALVAAGANVLLFTTGRGTPLGFPVPTLKIASNSAIAARKPSWIDFDASRVLGGGSDAEATDSLFALVLATASGRLARNEANGERDIALWKGGVTL